MTAKKETKKTTPSRRRRRSDTVADWGGADGELLREAVEATCKDGGAIRFGYSRDGGAYSIGIYGDGKPFTEYLPGTSDVDEWLTGIIDDYA